MKEKPAKHVRRTAHSFNISIDMLPIQLQYQYESVFDLKRLASATIRFEISIYFYIRWNNLN